MKLPKQLQSARLWLRVRGGARDPVSGLPQQTGALPWRRRGDKLQVLLVTGRISKRWTIPKGWPMVGKTLAEAAAREAYEEGGVEGEAAPEPIGRFDHIKLSPASGPLPVTITVHALEVRRTLPSWPEKGSRERRWLSPAKAAKLVENKQLAAMLLDFCPDNAAG